MVVVEPDVKLDYSDVLIRPKRSIMSSRKDVVLTRKFKFPISGVEWEGVPIIAAIATARTVTRGIAPSPLRVVVVSRLHQSSSTSLKIIIFSIGRRRRYPVTRDQRCSVSA